MHGWYPLSKLIAPIALYEEADAADSRRSDPNNPFGRNTCHPHSLEQVITRLKDLGLNSFLIYPFAKKHPGSSDTEQLQAFLDRKYILWNTLNETIIRHPETLFIVDLCTCHFLTSGQCGFEKMGLVNNQMTLEFLAKLAALLANMNVSALSISSMMDGVISTIRAALIAAGFPNILLVSQSAKIHSGFYSPFQVLSGGLKSQELKKSYQVEVANRTQMEREIALDQEEGADLIVLKPVGESLDLTSILTRRFSAPLLGYTTGGEYLMLKDSFPEAPKAHLSAINRYFGQMGATGISAMISYFASEYAQLRVDLAIK